MSEHIHSGLTLFEGDVPDEGLVDSVRWFHFNEKHFAKYRLKPLKLYSYRATHFPG
jgi:hypothetical protein